MNNISAEYKKMVEEDKQLIEKLGNRVVDEYETENFIVIVAISKNHMVREHIYGKLNRQWSVHTLSVN